MYSLLDHRTASLLAPERLLWHIETELPRSLKSRDSASYETSEPASRASMNGLCSATLPESPREAWWVAARKALRGAGGRCEQAIKRRGVDRTVLVESSRKIISSKNAYIVV